MVYVLNHIDDFPPFLTDDNKSEFTVNAIRELQWIDEESFSHLANTVFKYYPLNIYSDISEKVYTSRPK